MSLDTRYRPTHPNDVLGQVGTTKVFRQLIKTGTGFRQSYLLAGPFGSGKTTLARMLARGLLCESPTAEGDPCDKCGSCLSFLERGTADGFTEVDAATNSGVADVRRITEEIQYSTFSGKRRVYLFDEAHQLTTGALDAMLKPMEEDVPGSGGDKRLVCIFCTTEPEKMKATILSRCAPAFLVRPVSAEEIAGRLAYVCQQEGFEYDPEMLPIIAEMSGRHIRDALKAIEGVSLLGAINRENVTAYLHLDLHGTFLDMIENIGLDQTKMLRAAQEALQRVPPTTCYERLAEVAMLAYRAALGVETVPVYWDAERVRTLGGRGDALLVLAQRFASRPRHPSAEMLFCDLSSMHRFGVSASELRLVRRQVQFSDPDPAPLQLSAPNAVSEKVSEAPANSTPPESPKVLEDVETKDVIPPTTTTKLSSDSGKLASKGPVEDDRPWINRQAVGVAGGKSGNSDSASASLALNVRDFCRMLGLHVRTLDEVEGGPTGCPHMDRNRTDEVR